MKKLTYLLLVLPLFLFNSCTEDIPSALTGTKWTYNVSGQDAWDMSGETGTLPSGAAINFAVTLNFSSSTTFTAEMAASMTYDGQTQSMSDNQIGIYTYDNKTGKVTMTIDGSDETATIVKNKLTLVSGGKTMVFTKK